MAYLAGFSRSKSVPAPLRWCRLLIVFNSISTSILPNTHNTRSIWNCSSGSGTDRLALTTTDSDYRLRLNFIGPQYYLCSWIWRHGVCLVGLLSGHLDTRVYNDQFPSIKFSKFDIGDLQGPSRWSSPSILILMNPLKFWLSWQAYNIMANTLHSILSFVRVRYRNPSYEEGTTRGGAQYTSRWVHIQQSAKGLITKPNNLMSPILLNFNMCEVMHKLTSPLPHTHMNYWCHWTAKLEH